MHEIERIHRQEFSWDEIEALNFFLVVESSDRDKRTYARQRAEMWNRKIEREVD